MRTLRITARVVAGLQRSEASGLTCGAPGLAGVRDALVITNGLVSAEAEPGGWLPRGVAEIDLTGHVVLPGLVNCHDHLQLNGAPEQRPDRRFRNAARWIAWLEERIGSVAEDRARPPGLDAPLELRLWQDALKNVLGGATTVAHHDPCHEILEHPDLPIRLVPCGWAHSPELAEAYRAAGREDLFREHCRRPVLLGLAWRSAGLRPGQRG